MSLQRDLDEDVVAIDAEHRGEGWPLSSSPSTDRSGWSPEYFPPQLVRAANTQLRTKVLFGSDYPLLRPERWIADFEKLDIRDEVKPLIMKQNAITALGLR